jgi:hypothetical protein
MRRRSGARSAVQLQQPCWPPAQDASQVSQSKMGPQNCRSDSITIYLEFFGRTGGDGGIRTLDRALQPYNGLANRRLQPLGHISAHLSKAQWATYARRTAPLQGRTGSAARRIGFRSSVARIGILTSDPFAILAIYVTWVRERRRRESRCGRRRRHKGAPVRARRQVRPPVRSASPRFHRRRGGRDKHAPPRR